MNIGFLTDMETAALLIKMLTIKIVFQMLRKRTRPLRHGCRRGPTPVPGPLPATRRGAEDRAPGGGVRAALLRVQHRLRAAAAYAGHGECGHQI